MNRLFKTILPVAVIALTLTSCASKVTYSEYKAALDKVEAITYQKCKINYSSKDDSSQTNYTFNYVNDDGTWVSDNDDGSSLTWIALNLTYLVTVNLGKSNADIKDREGYNYYTGMFGFKVEYIADEYNKEIKEFNSYGYPTKSTTTIGDTSVKNTTTTTFTWSK